MNYKLKQQLNFKYKNNLLENETKSEKQFELILKDLNINYKKQKGWLARNKTFCISDFYLPKPYKLAIEIDGLYHSLDYQKVIDQYKDNYLYNKRGIKTIRFSNDLILSNSNKVKEILLGILTASKTGKLPKESPVKYAV